MLSYPLIKLQISLRKVDWYERMDQKFNNLFFLSTYLWDRVLSLAIGLWLLSLFSLALELIFNSNTSPLSIVSTFEVSALEPKSLFAFYCEQINLSDLQLANLTPFSYALISYLESLF